jgi:hypothetical protein
MFKALLWVGMLPHHPGERRHDCPRLYEVATTLCKPLYNPCNNILYQVSLGRSVGVASRDKPENRRPLN